MVRMRSFFAGSREAGAAEALANTNGGAASQGAGGAARDLLAAQRALQQGVCLQARAIAPQGLLVACREHEVIL